MLTFAQDGSRFNYRVAGVAFRGEEVLLHRGFSDDFWTLPGGHVEMGESTESCLRREMQEELAATIAIERLLWVVENFFQYDSQAYHELAFYYLFTLPADCQALSQQDRFPGLEDDNRIEFRWFRLDELPGSLLPSFLIEGLRSLPSVPTHVVHRDE